VRETKKSKTRLKPKKLLSRSAAKMRLLKSLRCTSKYEKQLWAAGIDLVAGVDEVGRGSLFGPVVAAAVVLDPKYRIRGLRDSKLLKPEQRERLAAVIRRRALGYSVAAVDAARIDQINIYHASRLAMVEAVRGLSPPPAHLLIDAFRIDHPCQQTPIVHGDALSMSIAAASIIAKVARDAMMREWDPIFPIYKLASNKGYYTREHARILREQGPSPLHRLSFAPVWMASAPQQVLEFVLSEEAPVPETAVAVGT
jgi:ribonuclease HII